MDFISVDFETPNRKNDAICAMGITLVKDSAIVFNRRLLINPHAVFDNLNVSIHGITRQAVADAPSFADVWAEYGRLFRHYPIVMHNARYDYSVLKKSANRSRVLLPPMDIYCTLTLTRENHPDYDSFSLDDLARRYALPLEHHNPASDSLVTAQIMLRLLADENAAIHTAISPCPIYEAIPDFDPLESESPADAPPQDEPLPRNAAAIFFSGGSGETTMPDCCYSSDPVVFEGHAFCITGNIPGCPRKQMEEYIISHGGRVASSVSKKIQYLIIGEEDVIVVGNASGKSSKIARSEELIEKGFPIALIRGDRFAEIILGNEA